MSQIHDRTSVVGRRRRSGLSCSQFAIAVLAAVVRAVCADVCFSSQVKLSCVDATRRCVGMQ
jgi:hypothetical protein